MILTPDEAKTKWCPFARVDTFTDGEGIATVNRVGEDDFDRWPHCVADKCMAWKWRDRKRTRGGCGLVVDMIVSSEP